MELRPYQKEIINRTIEMLDEGRTPFVVDCFQGCLAGDTKILTPSGYRAIKDIKAGDIVGSWNDTNIEWNKVECKSITMAGHKPKPMIELEYELYLHLLPKENRKPDQKPEERAGGVGENVLFKGMWGEDAEYTVKNKCKGSKRTTRTNKIRTTYDHKFYYNGRYYPLYQLIWGRMEEGQRVQLELLCKQYGADFDYELQRGLSCWDNPPSERPSRIPQNGYGWENSKSPQGNSTNLGAKPDREADGKPHKRSEDGQPSGELGVGDMGRAGSARNRSGVMGADQNRDEGSARSVESNNGRTTIMDMGATRNTHRQEDVEHEEVKNHRRDIRREQLEIQTINVDANQTLYTQSAVISSISVLPAEDYHAITVSHCHSYIVEGGFPTHNSGKSVIISELVRQLNRPTLILCMSKELVEQDVAKLRAVGADATIYSASLGEKKLSDITVGTIGSLYKKPEDCRRFELVIIDEVDSVPTDQKNSMYMQLLNQINADVIGWTGTPFRMTQDFVRKKDGLHQIGRIKPLTEIGYWKYIMDGINYWELRERGYIAPIKYFSDSDNINGKMLRLNSSGSDYTEESLISFGEWNRRRVAGNAISAVEKWGAKRVLVTVPNIEEAEAVAELIKQQSDIPADYLHSKLNKRERDERVKKFKQGQTKIMVQVLILNIGFDLPELDCIIFARPSKSLRIWCQTVARGIRVDPTNPDKLCKVIDMGFMYEKFGAIENVKVKHEWERDTITTDLGSLARVAVSDVNITEVRKYNAYR